MNTDETTRASLGTGRGPGDVRRPHPTRPEAVPEPLLTPDALCDLLGCHRRTLQREVTRGSFPPPDLRVGKSPRWRPSTYTRWVKGGGR